MVNVSGPVSFSPSAVGTYRDCPARFCHERHDDGSGLLPTDAVAALVSSAFHGARMLYHRRVESWYVAGQRPADDVAQAQLQALVQRELAHQQIDPSVPDVAARLRRARPGLDAIAVTMIEEMPTWATDGEMLLVWAENKLDHGPGIRAVQLQPDVLMPTRPDIVGIRRCDDGAFRAVIRDYKAKRDAVDPAFDDGIIVRAFWALSEVIEPRCRWFLAGRGIEVAADTVELETVNILHGRTGEFIRSFRMSERAIYEHRDRLAGVCHEMGEVDAIDDAQMVVASPGGLCQRWCPYLHRCAPGRAFVKKYAGDEALAERLAELP